MNNAKFWLFSLILLIMVYIVLALGYTVYSMTTQFNNEIVYRCEEGEQL